jgi:hypothetical protein
VTRERKVIAKGNDSAYPIIIGTVRCCREWLVNVINPIGRCGRCGKKPK